VKKLRIWSSGVGLNRLQPELSDGGVLSSAKTEGEDSIVIPAITINGAIDLFFDLVIGFACHRHVTKSFSLWQGGRSTF
jgi:hypothetical protein